MRPPVFELNPVVGAARAVLFRAVSAACTSHQSSQVSQAFPYCGKTSSGAITSSAADFSPKERRKFHSRVCITHFFIPPDNPRLFSGDDFNKENKICIFSFNIRYFLSSHSAEGNSITLRWWIFMFRGSGKGNSPQKPGPLFKSKLIALGRESLRRLKPPPSDRNISRKDCLHCRIEEMLF